MRAVARALGLKTPPPGAHEAVTGTEHIGKMIVIDQSPIGRTPRSNPATYIGAFDLIRALFARVPDSRVRGYSAGRFSFNVKGGRCEECRGDGLKKIEMQFLPDVYVVCEACQGRRYNLETLNIRYRGRSIADVLDMTVADAADLFAAVPRLKRQLGTLCEVGLGYVKLGQPATTLSGGEAQRVKLAAELARTPSGHTLYVLDEPTTGLHLADVENLLAVLLRLRDHGNTVLVVEHHLDVLKVADYIVDLGPEGGDAGGELVAAGTPEEVACAPRSHTGHFLRPLLGLAEAPA
jgi:excinuclease ABC subunit A